MVITLSALLSASTFIVGKDAPQVNILHFICSKYLFDIKKCVFYKNLDVV